MAFPDRRASSLVRRHLAALCFLLAAAPAARAQVAITEVLFDPSGVDTGAQVVELQNQGAAPADIGGYWLSFKPAAWQFPKPLQLAPGGIMVVHLNRAGTDGPTDLFTGTAGMRNLSRSDSIALFKGNLFSDPASIVDFVEWGSAGQDAETVAEAAALWTSGQAVDVAALREGSSIARTRPGGGSSAWCIDGTPSIGAANDECTPSQEKSPVRINEILPGPGSLVELVNAGSTLEVLDGKWLLGTGASAYAFPAGSLLLPGRILVVHLGATGQDDDAQLFTGPAFAPLSATDSIAFSAGPAGSDSSFLIDYAEWGAAGLAREDQAARAGLWTAGEAIQVGGLIAGGAVASEATGEGLSRWVLDNTPTPGEENGEPPQAPMVLNEVMVTPVPAGPSAIEIRNRGEGVLDLSGVLLCTTPAAASGAPSCATFPPGTKLAKKQVLVVVLQKGVGAPGTVSLDLPVLRPLTGELALLVAADWENPNNYLDYLRWGVGLDLMGAKAVSAGLWLEGDSIDPTGLAAGASIAYEGRGTGVAAYRVDPFPTIGYRNDERHFVRGDCNQDGRIDITDPITLLLFLFQGETPPPCDDACDTNDDGRLDISDPIYSLAYLFGGAPAIPPRTCGAEATDDDLTCESFAPCR